MRASVGRPMTAFVLTLLERFDESPRDPRRAGARGARLRRPFGCRRLPRGARLDPIPRGQCARAPRPTPRRRSGSHATPRAPAATRPIAASVAVLAGMERERPFEELEAIVAALPPAGDPDTVVQDDLALARAWLMLAQGDAQGAADRRSQLDRADSWGCSSPTLLPWRSVASVALAQLGDEERALDLAQEELRLAQELGTPRAVGIAQRAVAFAGPADERQAGARGRGRDAREGHREARAGARDLRAGRGAAPQAASGAPRARCCGAPTRSRPNAAPRGSRAAPATSCRARARGWSASPRAASRR